MPGPLRNSRHECFAVRVARGETLRGAYCAIYNVPAENPASASANRLTKIPAVAARIDELKESQGASTVLSLRRKRELMHDFATADLSRPASELLPMAQGVKYDPETGALVQLTMPNKISAIELDAKLCGELSGPQIGVSLVLSFDQQRMLLPGRDVVELDDVG